VKSRVLQTVGLLHPPGASRGICAAQILFVTYSPRKCCVPPGYSTMWWSQKKLYRPNALFTSAACSCWWTLSEPEAGEAAAFLPE
jgi:hypothetical protein